MKIRYAIRDFFFPPKCAGCREIFRVKYGEKNELCSECAKKWELLKATICPDCGEPWFLCHCAPSLLGKAGATTLIKLVPYRHKSAVSNNVILYVKRNCDKRTFDCLSDQVSYELKKYCEKIGIRRDDAIVTFAPRRQKTVSEIGFDQAKLLSRMIASKTGISFVPTLKRMRSGGRAQKKLDSSQRADNVKGIFELKKGVDVGKKTVFIFDDLVTTGATMSECVKLFKKQGASLIVGICISSPEKTEPTRSAS
jgi:ComF family protein